MVSKCPNCKKVFELDESWKDKQAKCDSCRNVFQVFEHIMCPNCGVLTPNEELCRKCSANLKRPSHLEILKAPGQSNGKVAFSPISPVSAESRPNIPPILRPGEYTAIAPSRSKFNSSMCSNVNTYIPNNNNREERNIDKALIDSISSYTRFTMRCAAIYFYIEAIAAVFLLYLYVSDRLKLSIPNICVIYILPFLNIMCGTIIYNSVNLKARCKHSHIKQTFTYVYNAIMLFALIDEIIRLTSADNISGYNFKVLIIILYKIYIYNKAWNLYKQRALTQLRTNQ